MVGQCMCICARAQPHLQRHEHHGWSHCCGHGSTHMSIIADGRSPTCVSLFACACSPTHTSVIMGDSHPTHVSLIAGTCGSTHVRLVMGVRCLTLKSFIMSTHGSSRMSLVVGCLWLHSRECHHKCSCPCTHMHMALPLPQNHPLFTPSPHSGLTTWKGWGTLI